MRSRPAAGRRWRNQARNDCAANAGSVRSGWIPKRLLSARFDSGSRAMPVDQSRSELRKRRRLMDSPEQMSRKRPAMALVVVREELGLVGCHVDAGWAFAFAAFARQAQVQRVVHGRVGGAALEKIPRQGLE